MTQVPVVFMKRSTGAARIALLIAAWVLVLPLVRAQSSTAPLPPTYAQMRHNSGQSVVPVYDGWYPNPDGTFDMVFGYYNRNFQEHPVVPIGVNNSFSPGPDDRGQPGYFYPRLNRNVFRVQVPADWGTRELVWSLTINGKTERAPATLLPEWEIERVWEFGGGGDEKNQPPSLTVAPAFTVRLPERLTVSAAVTDDGLPTPPTRRPRILNQGQDAFPTLHKGEKGPVNVPLAPAMPRPPQQGLSVGFVLYRGPAAVRISPSTFQTLGVRTGGSVAATVTFSQPGTYVLRGVASDGPRRDVKLVTVTVTDSGTPP